MLLKRGHRRLVRIDGASGDRTSDAYRKVTGHYLPGIRGPSEGSPHSVLRYSTSASRSSAGSPVPYSWPALALPGSAVS